MGKKRRREAAVRKRSAAEREALYMEIANRWLDELGEVPDLCYEEAHLIAYNLLDSIEKKMLLLGYKPSELPTYKRRLGGQSRADAGCFTYCKRCECVEQEDGLWYCTVFSVGPAKERYEVTEDDGCARGIPRREYR